MLLCLAGVGGHFLCSLNKNWHDLRMEGSVDLVGTCVVISSGFLNWKCPPGQSHFAQRESSVFETLTKSV